MTWMVVGLVLFLGVHSIRTLAPRWRNARVVALGEQRWKAIISVLSLLSFVLLVWGYGEARAVQTDLWAAPRALRHFVGLIVLPAFILLAAVYLPGTRIRATVKHPMLAATKLWALAHLLVNSRPCDLVLFGGFLAWSIAAFISCRNRDRVAGTVYAPGSGARDAMAVGIGVVAWAGFAFLGHGPLIGVKLFPN